MDKVITSLTVLLTGFVVVFLVLLLLIGVIKLYSAIVRAIENRAKRSKEKKAQMAAEKSVAEPVRPVETAEAVSAPPTEDGAIPQEIIAVIAAAVDSMYGEGSSSRIKSIKKSPSSRSAWGNAGVLQNTRPF